MQSPQYRRVKPAGRGGRRSALRMTSVAARFPAASQSAMTSAAVSIAKIIQVCVNSHVCHFSVLFPTRTTAPVGVAPQRRRHAGAHVAWLLAAAKRACPLGRRLPASVSTGTHPATPSSRCSTIASGKQAERVRRLAWGSCCRTVASSRARQARTSSLCSRCNTAPSG